LERKYVFRKVTTSGVGNRPVQFIPEVKLKQCGKSLIIRRHLVTARKDFTYNINIICMPFRFIIFVHIIIEHFQKMGILIRSGTVINMLHRIQTESVNSLVYPFFCSSGYCFICRRLVSIINSTVIKVGKPVCLEMGMEIPCFDRCKQYVLRICITQSKRLAQLHFTCFRRSTILRSVVP